MIANRQPLYFRVEATSQIGLGHLIRCLSLAKMLESDFSPTFLCQFTPPNLIELIERENFPVIVIPAENLHCLHEEKNLYRNILSPKDLMVLDGYHFTLSYQRFLKEFGITLIMIDDNAEIEFCADLIINHNAYATNLEYKTVSYCQLALGTDYILLRPEFLQNKDFHKDVSSVKRVFLCLGGSDYDNSTFLLTQYLIQYAHARHLREWEIDIVVGPGYLHWDCLRNWVASFPCEASTGKIYLEKNLSAAEMCTHLKACDLAIVPTSGLIWEVCMLGIPAIAGMTAENQFKVMDAIKEKEAAHCLGWWKEVTAEKLWQALDSLKQNQELRKQMIGRQKTLVDGKSPERYRKIFRGLLNN